jgi:hypothetical protein
MKEMQNLAMMILDDIEELNAKLLTMRNTQESIDVDTTTINNMISSAKEMRQLAISNVDVIRSTRVKLN